MVSPFKTWFLLCQYIFYHSKVVFLAKQIPHTKDVCQLNFIGYCVTEFKTIFHRLKNLQFLFLPPKAPN